MILSVNAHSSQIQTQPPIKTAVLHLTVNKQNELHITTGLNMLHFTYYAHQCKTAACGNKMALPHQNLVVYTKFDICTNTTFITEKIRTQHINYSTQMKRLMSNKDLTEQIITRHCVQVLNSLYNYIGLLAWAHFKYVTILGPKYCPTIYYWAAYYSRKCLRWSGKKKHEYSVLKVAKFLDCPHMFTRHETRSC